MASLVPRGSCAALAFLSPVLACSALAQAVPEGVHSQVHGPTEICGITASSATDFIEAVHADARFSRAEVNSDRFEMYVSADGWTQWVATLPGEPAYPAITCRHAYQDNAGAWLMDRKMRCDGTRAQCDALYLEFQTMDREMIEEVKRTTGRQPAN